MKPTPEQLARCPKVVRDYIRDLERRDDAITRLNDEITKGGYNLHFGYTDVRRAFGEPAIMLPKYANLMAFPMDSTRTLRLDAGRDTRHPFRLTVMSISTGLVVRPESSNVVSIESEGY